MLKWTVGHRKTEGPKSPSGPCYSIRRALHLARRSRTPGRDKENKGHGSHRHSQCLSPRTRDSVYMCLEAIPAALRDISNQNHTHGPTTSNQHHTHGPTASNRYHTHGPTASNQYNTHGPTASNQYHTHGPTASNQYHTHGPTASKRCCSQGRRTRTAPRDYKHSDRETRRDLVSTPRRISLCDVDSKSTLISSTSLPPLGRSDVTSPSRLMQIDYSPCPMKTTKSLLALRRRLVDAFNQSSSSSVGTPHLAPPLSVDNPLYFSLRDVPCPGPVNRALSTSGKVEGTTPSCEAIPHKIRKRSLAARFPSGIEREEADDHTSSVYSGVSTQEGHRGATWSSMHVLSMNLASLSLSNASRDGSLSLPSSRITPPSPFLNSTHASSISSTNQHDLLKACVPAIRDSRLKAFVPILEDAHDLTDPRFLSHLTFMEATVMPAKNSSIFHGFQKVRLSKGFRGSSSENEPAQTSSYLEFVDSGVDMTRSNDEYSVRSRRYSLRKRNSTRRVRTVTSTSEDGPPTKVQSVESDTGLSVIPFSGEMTSLDASRSCHTPANTEYCQKILRHRKSFRSSARRSRRNSLKGIGDGVFKRENTICDSIFNECGRKDLYNLNSSGDSLDRSFSLRRQGGFRRKNRGFVTGEAARSCTDVTTTCQMTKHSLLGASSPFSQQSEGGTVSIPGITNTTFTVQEFDPGSPDPGKLNQPSSRDKSFSLTLPKGIPSPPSPTCHSVELTSPTGMDTICPLATSPGPQGGMERAVALWEGANPITNVWQRNEWRMNGLKDGNMSTSPSDETWNSHTMNALRTPVLTSGHILRSSYTTTSTDQQEGQDVAESPLALVEHRSRSRRCLLFASPGSSTRHCRSSKRRGSWKKSRECCQDRGELELALYENNGLLTIHVISGKNLRRPGGKSCNAYVKVNLVPSTEERTFHRTPVHRNCTSPLFDQQFSVELLEGDVDKRVLVSVWHRDRERRRSEFLGCMSFAVKHAIKKDISGSYRLSSQTSGRPQPVAMPRHSISSTEEVISLDSDVPVRTGMEGGRACPKKPVDCKPAGAEDSTFLRHLELEPLPEEGEGPPLPLKGGRTPFTTTRRLVRNPSVGGGFGFSIAWTQPPRVERVETGLPADQAGLLPGDYVIFVEKDNVVTLPEDEILQLIRSCGNEVTLEVYRRTTPNGLVGSSTLTATGGGSGVFTAPPQPSTATCSVTTASLDLSKRRLHLPQVTFSSETEPLNREETRRRAVYQLLYKEQHYAMCLQFGISRFLLPLAERKDLLTPQEHVLLFQNVDELLRLTEDTLEQLVHEESEALGQHLGRVYLKKTPSLNSAYRRYFSGIKKADCLLAAKTRNSHFMRIVLEPAVPRRRPDLTSFLHKPLEHYRDILKLLQTILNNAKVTDDEYPALARVVQEMQSMYRDVTMGSGLMEPEGEGRPLLSLQDLESRLVFTRCKPFVLSSPGRQWIFGGDLSRVEGRAARPFWALLFSDLILFTKVSRDRVLFITEEPLSLLSVTQAFFNIRKKDNEFRLQVDGAPEGTDSPAQGGCGPELQLTRSNKKNTRKRAVTLRAPTAELKAVWQNLIQRQIIYLNTTRGGTPASSPLESPDRPTTLSVATLDSLPLRRQAPVPDYKSLDELIEHKCRQLGKSGAHKGSALHLEQWMKGKLGAGGPLTPEDEPEPEVWSLETLRRRSEQLQLGLIGRSDSRCEEVDVSDTERSQSRSTERSRSDSQVTVRSGGLEQPVAVCRQCHKTCLASSPGDLEDDDDDLDGNWGPLILMGMSALNATIGLGAGATAGIAPADPFSPSELPLISVLPPTPDTLPRNSSLQWEDSDLSLIVVSSPSGSSPSPDTTQVQETPEEEDSGEEGGQEEPPYRALSSPPGLKRYGTLASLEMLESDEEDDVEGEWRSEEEEDQSVGGGNQQMEAMTLSLRGWTTRAGSYVAEKMALFEDSRAAAFLDRYLRPTTEPLPEQNTTSCGTGELEECDTSVGTSGEEVWGTPTSGGDLDEELSFPSVDTPKVSVSDFLADSASLTGVGDDDTELMMDELLATPPLACGGVRVFPQRRRLEPLPEEEDTDSPGSPPCSPTTLQDQDTPSPEQAGQRVWRCC